MKTKPVNAAAQALIEAGEALQRLASGPLGLGPSFLTTGKYAREAGEKLVTAGEQLKLVADEPTANDR
ncbi:MAG TPA: hypothetical protein VHK65_09210 [Candidatus Dormibacteraeota bacterium]|nr:hypothetical protein [Candidatus Dormibacteraeota bacterium]